MSVQQSVNKYRRGYKNIHHIDQFERKDLTERKAFYIGKYIIAQFVFFTKCSIN